jgi:hypothetical protein
MGLTRSEKDAALQALYDQIPAIPDCDGRCWTSCGPIDMSDRERTRLRDAGQRITPYRQALASLDTYWCEALTGDKRCAVYEMRPLVCRLWGAAEGLPCVYGCVPVGGYLSDEDAYRLIAESMRVGGHPGALPEGTDVREALRVAMERKEVAAAVQRIRTRGRAGDQRRAADTIPAAFRRR